MNIVLHDCDLEGERHRAMNCIEEFLAKREQNGISCCVFGYQHINDYFLVMLKKSGNLHCYHETKEAPDA